MKMWSIFRGAANPGREPAFSRLMPRSARLVDWNSSHLPLPYGRGSEPATEME